VLHAKKVLLAAVLSTSLFAATSAELAQASAVSPKIKARPHSVMVTLPTTLKGKGFPANTLLQLRECGRTFWLAPADPCLENGISVMTDAKGKFQASFEVGLCPEGEPTKKPTQRVCYIGELMTGEDTGSLVGAARIVVTFP
jgi:hypothetical protein